jgi:acyl-lipid omega-6 desaturase (Delta-12 desaturase)
MNEPSRQWIARLAAYKDPDNARAIWEIIITFVPFALLWGLMASLTPIHYGFALLLMLPAAGLMVRLFIIQHDCGHGAMFSSAKANDWVGRITGIFTLTPYDYWRHSHALHHLSSGNLDKRGFGDIDTLTVAEYCALSWRGKLSYRLYRHPFVMFVIGPAYLFILQHRLPVGAMRKGQVPWTSTLSTNLGIFCLYTVLILIFGWKTFLLVQVPIVMLGASIGVWLFYVQHQFDETHWARETDWSRENAALHGSSYYDLPKPLMWLTGNIGIHHVHHLSSRIPFHRLPKVLADYPELKTVGRLTIRESIRCVPLTLWDEGRKKLISFRDYRQMARNGITA